MKKQLIEMKVPSDRIYYWGQYKAQYTIDRIKFDSVITYNDKAKVLVLSNGLIYDGGSLVVVYACYMLKQKGYEVVLAAPYIDARFEEELLFNKIKYAIMPALPYVTQVELNWICQFDIVLINTFLMLKSVISIAPILPVIWWLHDPSSVYEEQINECGQQLNNDLLSKIKIYAVSNIARLNFFKHYPNAEISLLELGIPDNKCIKIESNQDIITFILIGSICELKAQDVIINAIEKLPSDLKKCIKLLLVGNQENTKYSNKILEKIKLVNEIQFLGLKNRAELQQIFSVVDVVVCTSHEETLSMAIVEGMLNGKICITSDKTGISQYIHSEVDGYIFQDGNVDELACIIADIFKNREDLSLMKQNARKLYEQIFSMEKLGLNFDRVIQETLGGNKE